MKLVFNKNEKLEISVLHEVGGQSKDFNYIEMIKNLLVSKSLGEPELIGEFTDSEKNSIDSMVKHINLEVANFFSEEKEMDENG